MSHKGIMLSKLAFLSKVMGILIPVLFMIFMAWLILGSFDFSEPEYPLLEDYVNDYADIFDEGEELRIEQLAEEIEAKTSAEIVVLTVESLGGREISEYSISLLEEQGIGKSDEDNGVLLLIAPYDREYRVEVGYGLEHLITDSQKVPIGRDILEYNFKQGEYGKGTYEAVYAMGQLIQGNTSIEFSSNVTGSGDAAGDDAALFLIFVIIFVFVFIIIIVSIKFGVRGGGSYGGRYGGGSSAGGRSSFGGGSFGGGGFSGRW